MKNCMLIWLSLCTFSVFADVQINQQTKSAHAPYDAQDTDREYFVSNVQSTVDAGAAASVIVSADRVLLCWTLQPEFVGLSQGEQVVVTSAESDEACTVTDANGTSYTSEVWASVTTMQGSCSAGGTVKVNHMVWCTDGVANE